MENQSSNIFWTAEAKLPAKNRKLQRAVFEKNAKKPHFWAFWAKKADFGPFLAKKGPFSNFRRKSENVTFLLIFSFFNTKNQKILMRGFLGKWAHTDERTYGRTYGRTDERRRI